MADRHLLRPGAAPVDAAAFYSVGREDRSSPWLVLDPCRDAAHAAALDRAAPMAVAAGTLGTRRGADILASLEICNGR